MNLSAIEKFDNLPRISLSNLNTPIELLSLSEVSPHDRLYIKRDDFIGSLVWGNKLRKLEYSIADALAMGADTIITCGAVQSNHARITAQVCKRLGLQCILVQNGEKPKVPSGNHKINLLLNTRIVYVASPQQRAAKMLEVFDEVKSGGGRPFIIPLGASNAAGCPGFVNAMRELKQQQQELGIEFDYIFHATSSGGTQAGMEVGKRLFGLNKLQIIGISVDNSVEQITDSVLQCTNPLLEKLGHPFRIEGNELNTDTNFIGEGYGIPTQESTLAMAAFLRQGVMLDKTYTAKAAAGLMHYLRDIPRGKNILFWHTGGLLAEL